MLERKSNENISFITTSEVYLDGDRDAREVHGTVRSLAVHKSTQLGNMRGRKIQQFITFLFREKNELCPSK